MESEKKNRMEQLNNCYFAKTVLMFIILFYHSILFWKGSWFRENPVYNAPILAIVSDFLNTFHIYTFTLISGYIFFYLKYENSRYSKIVPFICNKGKRLLIPYIFISIIWVIPISTYFFNYNLSTIIKKYVLGISPGQLWFLLMLFNVFILMFILKDIVINKPKIGLLLMLVLYGIGLMGSELLPNIFQIFTAFKYCIFFYLGMIFRKNDLLSIKINRIKIVLLFSTGIVLFSLREIIVYNMNMTIWTIIIWVMDFILALIGSILCFVLLQKIANNLNYSNNNAFKVISSRTMCIYLFHQQVIYFCLSWFNGVVNPYINAFLNFGITFILCMIIAMLMFRFKTTRFLIGEK